MIFNEKILVFLIKLGVYGILLTSLLVDSDYFFPFVVPKAVMMRGLISSIFVFYILLISRFPQYRPRFNALTVAFLSFVGVYTLAAALGMDPLRSFWGVFERMTGVLMWWYFAILFIIVSSVFKGIKEVKKLALEIVTISTIIAGIFLFQKFGIEIIKHTQMGSTLGNSSFFGAYLIFPIFLNIWLFLEEQRRVFRILFGMSLFVLINALLTATAYGAMFATFGGILLLFLLWFPLRMKVGIFLLGITIAFFALSFLPSFEGAINTRLATWNNAIQGFKERPILGWGPENFNTVFAKHFNPCMPLPECAGEIWYDKAHNIVLDTLIDAGIFGLYLYISLFVIAIYSIWRRYSFVIRMVFIPLLLAYFAQNLLVFDIVSTQMMFVITLGMVGALMTNNTPYVIGKKNPYLLLLLIIPILMFFFGSIQPARVSMHTKTALSNPTEISLEYFQKALLASPMAQSEIPYQTMRVFVSSVQANNADDETLRKLFNLAAWSLHHNLERNPNNYRALLSLGQLYIFASKEFDDTSYLNVAETALLTAIELSPTNQLGYIALANVKLRKGEIEEAGELYRKAVNLEPRHKLMQQYLSLYNKALLEMRSE